MDDDLGFGELNDILHLNKSAQSSTTTVILPIRALLHDHGVHSASLPSCQSYTQAVPAQHNTSKTQGKRRANRWKDGRSK